MCAADRAAERAALGPWRLSWAHGSAEVQAMGGMLGPVQFRLDDERELDVMHVAPWSGLTRASALPGMLRRLRGEWPCIPFGRTDAPSALPPGWQLRSAGDAWGHGYAANHRWHCLHADAGRVHLALDYPAGSAVARVERTITAAPHAAALDISLTVWARRATRLPLGLHPTFRLPPAARRVRLLLGRHHGIHSYPVLASDSVTRLQPDTCSADLSALAGIDGPLDLSHLPADGVFEELLQARALQAAAGAPPFALHYLDYDACVGLWWDTAQLPDLLLWVSNGGRQRFPWQGRHLALGAEPVNSLFDLGRVATAPAGHALADRTGIALDPAAPWHTTYRIAAWQAGHGAAGGAP
ncbi:hypothetical protein [Duganella sp. Root1480D1]|uniref:hypothetical protein n=1 Tax=Duganella sp. Root1480D1 TaxID=1736471 RepID=UPI00070D89CE|nr:hypothetical protein [Duganella sp. Root1480D1]KQZ43188.1 hypothetical protein ASD58_23280 [Duganella sp. Root1480D1]